MTDLSSFSSNDFNSTQWINAQLKDVPHGETLEGFLSSLSMKLHLSGSDYSELLETAMVESMSTMPRLVAEINRLDDQLKAIHAEMKNLSDQINTVDKKSLTGVEDLSRLDSLKSSLERCKSTLEEHARWSQLVREARQLLESGGTLSETADRIETMFRSLEVLKELPGHEDRLETCSSYRNSLLSALLPNISRELLDMGIDTLKEYLYVFKKLNRGDQFEQQYLETRPEALLEMWKSYQQSSEQALSQWLAYYLGSVSRFLIEEEQVILELFGSENRLKMLNKLLVRCLHGLRHELTDRLQSEQSIDAVEECGVVLEEFCKRIFPLLLAEDEGKLEFIDEVLETVFTGFLRFQTHFVELEEKRLKEEDENAMALIAFRAESANAIFEASASNKSTVSSEGHDLDLYDPVELIMGFVDGIMPSLVAFFEHVRRAVQRGERFMGGIGLKSFIRTIISAIQSLYKHLSKKLEVLSLALGMQDVSTASSLISDASCVYVSYSDEIKVASKLGSKVQSIEIDKQSLSTIILKSTQSIGRFKSLIIELENSVKSSSSDLLTSLFLENRRSSELLMSKPSLYFSILQLSRDDNISAELKSFLVNTISMSTSSSLSVLHSHAHRLAGVSNTMLLTHCISPITALLETYHYVEGAEKGVVDKDSEDIESFLDRLLPQSTITQVGESLLSWVQDLETFAGSDALVDLLSLKGEAYPLSCSSAGWKTVATKLELKDEKAIQQLASRYIVTKTMQAYEREVSQSGRNNGVKLKYYTQGIEADVSAEAEDILSPGGGQALVFVNEWLAVIADSIVGLFIARILALESSKAVGSVSASRAQLYADVDYLCNVINATGIRCHPLLPHLKHVVAENSSNLAATLRSLTSGKSLGSLKDVLYLDFALFRSIYRKAAIEY